MPYPNEHALRLKPPAIFDPDSFRRTAGGKLFGGKLTVPATIGLIWAKLKGRAKPSDPPILQAIRFKKSSWTVAAAKAWIKKNIKQAGTFEPAASSAAKSEELTEQDKEQDILFGDYDEYDNAEVVKFEELGEPTMTLDDIEEEPDPEAEARRQYEQLMAAYDEGVMEGQTLAASTEATGQEDTVTQDYAATAGGDKDKSTYNVPGVEVMAVGTWNNDVYKREDLDLIAKNFSLLKAQVKPPLVLGHGEQKLLEASGLPAAGWVSKLRRVGNKLLADFSDVPRAVANIIKNKGYKRVSVEIYPNYQAPNGIRFGLALARIALLGTDIPAIKTLKDVEALYSENSKNKTKEVVYMAAENKEETLHEEVEELEDEEEQDEEQEEETTQAATPDTDKPAEQAPNKKPKETTEQPVVMAELRKVKANYEEMKSKVEASSTIIKVLQDQLAQQKAKAELAYDEKFLDDMTAEGKLPPAVRSKALTLMGQLRSVETPLKYTELDAEGKEVEKEGTVLDVFKEMVESLAVTIDMAETATRAPAPQPGVYRGGQDEQFQKDGFPVSGLDTVDLVEKRVKELREESPGKTEYEYVTQAMLEVESKK